MRSGTDDVRVWSGVSATRQHVRRALTRRLGPFSRHVYYVACALLDRVLSSVFSFFNMCCRPRPGVCSETDHFSLAALSACGEGVHLNPRAVSQGLPYSLIPAETKTRSVGHRSSLLSQSGSHAGLFSFGHGRTKRFSRLCSRADERGRTVLRSWYSTRFAVSHPCRLCNNNKVFGTGGLLRRQRNLSRLDLLLRERRDCGVWTG